MNIGQPAKITRLSRGQVLSVAVMSVLAPVLAGSIQTTWILMRGIPSRNYQAVFYPHEGEVSLVVGFPVVLGVEAVITFLLVWSLMRVRRWLDWPTLFLCCALWMYVAFISIAPVL
jgi:hypothetical protein